MVDQTLNRRLAYTQRLQEVQEQHTGVDQLRAHVLPDGTTLGQADPDGALFDTLHALVGVVRKHPQFQMALEPQKGLRLQISAEDGNMSVDVLPVSTPNLVVDLRDDVAPSPTATLSSNDESALTAALRRQAGDEA